MLETHPLVLSLRCAGLEDLDPCNVDEVHNMWHAFSKAKNCIPGGDRLEYLSWRIYSREILMRQNLLRINNCEPVDGEPPTKIENPEQSDSDEGGTSAEDEWEDSPLDEEEKPVNEAVPTMEKLPTQSKKNQNNSRRSLINRRISSIELQNLFSGSPRSLNLCTKPNNLFSISRNYRASMNSCGSGRSAGSSRNESCNNSLTGSRDGSRSSSRNDSLRDGQEISIKVANIDTARAQNEFEEKDLAVDESPEFSLKAQTPTLNKSSASQKPDMLRSLSDYPPSVKPAPHHQAPHHPTPCVIPVKSHVVRGFSPSSVSVSVNRQSTPDIRFAAAGAMNRTQIIDLPPTPVSSSRISDGEQHDGHLAAESHETDAPKSEHNEAEHNENENNESETNLAPQKDRKNMFFIGTAEYDSESGLLGTSNDTLSAGPGVSSSSQALVSDMLGESVSVDDKDEWDDTDDEDADNEEEVDKEQSEEQRKQMFREVDVPVSPLLKRSLLSSLILNRLESADKEADAKETSVSSSNTAPGTTHNAQEDVGPMAESAPHFPLPAFAKISTYTGGDLPVRSAALPSTTRRQVARTRSDTITPSRNSAFSASSLDSDNQNPIIARPEMYRTSTASGIETVSNSDDRFRVDWQNLHEDIYDPMNYHSRGW